VAAGNVTPWETTWGILTPGGNVATGLLRGVSGEHIAAYPLFAFQGATMYPPQTMVFSYFSDDFTNYVETPMFVYSANVTYFPLGNTGMYGVSARGGNKSCIMIRWDY
jgi:hypothetical protein